MTRLANVVRRAGIYHFRRVVPPLLRQRLRRRELVRSLKTAKPAAAKLRGDLLYRASERLFAAAVSPMLSSDQLTHLIRDFYNLVLEIDDHRRLLDGPLSDEEVVGQAGYLDDLKVEMRQSLARNSFDDVSLATAIVLMRNGIDADALGPGEHNQIKQAIMRAGIDLTRALRDRYDGDFTYEPKEKLLGLHSRAYSSGTLPTRDPAADTPPTAASPPQPAGPLLSEVGATFREEQITTGAWDKQTAAQAGATYRLFGDVCGDKPLSVYGRSDAELFRKSIQRLPADYSKAPRYRGRSVEQILKVYEVEAAAKRSPLITQRTVKRHFSALSALWTSALAGGHVQQNIFSGFRFVSAKKASDQRSMWERDELVQLFASPLWAGCKSLVRRTEPGDVIVKDERFWLPLIAVFSGMRQEEICQLHVEDVRKAEGIWYFDVNDRPPRMLKNENAARLVPIHSELIRLGLIDHVEDCCKAGEERLFPGLQRGGADGRLGHAFSKWFTRYRRDIGLYRPGLDFHSFRHTATTFMHHAGIERAVIDHATGHATPGETSRYTKGSRLQQLQAAIEAIRLGFDVAQASVDPSNQARVISRARAKRRVARKRRTRRTIS